MLLYLSSPVADFSRFTRGRDPQVSRWGQRREKEEAEGAPGRRGDRASLPRSVASVPPRVASPRKRGARPDGLREGGPCPLPSEAIREQAPQGSLSAWESSRLLQGPGATGRDVPASLRPQAAGLAALWSSRRALSGHSHHRAPLRKGPGESRPPPPRTGSAEGLKGGKREGGSQIVPRHPTADPIRRRRAWRREAVSAGRHGGAAGADAGASSDPVGPPSPAAADASQLPFGGPGPAWSGEEPRPPAPREP